MNDIKITGTLIKNFFHCKRQAYLYYYGINFENEFTKIGDVLHKEQNSFEFSFDFIKIDKMDFLNKQIVEYKKSSSNFLGSKAQVLFYLNFLKSKGLFFFGKIIDLDFGCEYVICLDSKNQVFLNQVLEDIKILLSNKEFPKGLMSFKKCKNCSFFDYCFC